MSSPTDYFDEVVTLLQELIRTPSHSREEAGSAALIARFLESHRVEYRRHKNNVWAQNKHFDPTKKSILLNSHLDTVKPNAGYSRDPYDGAIEEGTLYGLGSNDAGASGVALLATFLHFYSRTDLHYNLILALTAEEEVSGKDGIESLLPLLPELDFAIVGEPTQMQLAIGERGLMVLDCVAHGTSGHAAREEGDNAIYKAMRDMEWFRTFRFPTISPLFGAVKMSVTILQAGTQHNVIPAECRFTVDVRVSDCYTNEEVLATIREHVECEVTPRSTRLRSSSIPANHPIVEAGTALGLTTFGSPTTSDQALLSIPSLKVGVGDSARSHSANEYVHLREIREGIALYTQMLSAIL